MKIRLDATTTKLLSLIIIVMWFVCWAASSFLSLSLSLSTGMAFALSRVAYIPLFSPLHGNHCVGWHPFSYEKRPPSTSTTWKIKSKLASGSTTNLYASIFHLAVPPFAFFLSRFSMSRYFTSCLVKSHFVIFFPSLSLLRLPSSAEKQINVAMKFYIYTRACSQFKSRSWRTEKRFCAGRRYCVRCGGKSVMGSMSILRVSVVLCYLIFYIILLGGRSWISFRFLMVYWKGYRTWRQLVISVMLGAFAA